MLHVLEGQKPFPASVAWSPDGTCVAAGTGRASVMVWDTATGVAVSDLAITGACDCFGYGISWSPVTGMLASAHHDRTVRVWNVGTG